MRARASDGTYRNQKADEVGDSETVSLLRREQTSREGIERELRVLRVGPNPRLVVCEYRELAERKVVRVNVRDNRKWLRGMRFKMREPIDEAEYSGVWRYMGRAPRRKGRW